MLSVFSILALPPLVLARNGEKDVYTFREDRAVGMRAFADQQEALRWVGLNHETS